MLREFNHIARQMLFLHGHLTRPADWAETRAEGPSPGGRPAPKRSEQTRRAHGLVARCAYGVVIVPRLIAGQFR
jgi:hypothetical protein